MTKLGMFALIVAATALPACVEATWSSRSYLSRDQSSSETDRDVTTTAREVTRLFEIRGFQLLDQHTTEPGGGLVIKLAKTNRPLAALKDDGQIMSSRDIGSVFYAWVTPHGAAGSRVELLGKPTLAGAEPCTKDGVKLPCTSITMAARFVDTFMSGHEEAQIVHGILSELQLEGFVVEPIAALQSPPVP